MANILGLNMHHADSSAAIIIDGVVIAAIAEERLGDRLKHTSNFPLNAISFVLEKADLHLNDIDLVAIARNPKSNIVAKLKWSLRNLYYSVPAYIETLRRSDRSGSDLKSLQQLMGASKPLKIFNVEHHVAHIASAYYTTDTSIPRIGISYDASGDFVSCMLALCQNGKISPKKRVTLPHSLGLFYTALCQFIGFDRFGEEYKVMGLAPYGEDRFSDQMAEIVKLKKDGTFEINEKYITMHKGGGSGDTNKNNEIKIDILYKDAMRDLFGEPLDRYAGNEQKQKDIAKSTQVMFEKAALNFVSAGIKKLDLTQAVMAGGSALNGVTNTKILTETNVSSVHLHPASGDDGTAVGAALYAYNNQFKQENIYKSKIFNPYLGSEYDDESILKSIKANNLNYEKLENDKLFAMVATLLSQANVIGWFQGRSEWGPRALGNRSIIADATNPNMKSLINSKIKRRENFRPFAPSLLAEDVNIYFKHEIYSPFMMHVVEFQDHWKAKFPAVVHVDGTGRLQTVTEDLNYKYYNLIKEFKKLVGHGLILNTSFNENEPIVETPEQAISCFLRTDMDAIVLGNFLIRKDQF